MKKRILAAVMCALISGCVLLTGCSGETAGNGSSTAESSTTSSASSDTEKTDEASKATEGSSEESGKSGESSVKEESQSGESSVKEDSKTGENPAEESSNTEEYSAEESIKTEEDSTEENSKTEESSVGESSKTEENSKAAHGSPTGTYVLDDSWETAQYINYFDGDFHSPDSEEIGRELIAALKKIMIGEETEEDYKFDYITRSVALYDFDNNKSVSLKFNGETIFIEDRFYKLIGAENLQSILKRIPDYEKTDVDSDGNTIEGPTPPNFRPFSYDDPYNTVPRYIKDPKDEEISVDQRTGERFVNDQLFVILADRNYSGQMYSIADETGAKIIGFLDDPDNKFQLRFSEAMTKEQLEKKAREIKKNKYVSDVYLYIVE